MKSTGKAMAIHSSALVWKIPWMEEPSGLQSMGSLRVRHHWATSLSLFPFITISWSLLRLMSVELVMPSNHVILSCPLLLLPSVFTSIRVFSESALCIGWPKYWRFSISPSNEYSGLISFRIDWFDLLVVQGTLKSLLHHHSSKAAILLGLIF